MPGAFSLCIGILLFLQKIMENGSHLCYGILRKILKKSIVELKWTKKDHQYGSKKEEPE